MIRFLVRTAIFLVSAAVGLLVAAALVDGVDVTTSGFLTAVVLFAVIQSILAPFIAKVTARNASAFLGGRRTALDVRGALAHDPDRGLAHHRRRRGHLAHRHRRRVAGHRRSPPCCCRSSWSRPASRRRAPGTDPPPCGRAPDLRVRRSGALLWLPRLDSNQQPSG